MVNKDFQSGIDGLIKSSLDKVNREDKPLAHKKPVNIKATYYYNKKQLDSIKAIAYYERKTIAKVISEALSEFISNYDNLEKAIELKGH